jgi:hypothetical protein
LAVFKGKVFLPFSGHWGDCGAYHGFVVSASTDEPGKATPRQGNRIEFGFEDERGRRRVGLCPWLQHQLPGSRIPSGRIGVPSSLKEPSYSAVLLAYARRERLSDGSRECDLFARLPGARSQ